jgi:hypothetical protein
MFASLGAPGVRRNTRGLSAREIISASNFDVALSVSSFQIFFASEGILFIPARLVINQF